MELLDQKEMAKDHSTEREKHGHQVNLLSRENQMQAKKISELEALSNKYSDQIMQLKENFILREKELIAQLAGLEKERFVQTQISTTQGTPCHQNLLDNEMEELMEEARVSG